MGRARRASLWVAMLALSVGLPVVAMGQSLDGRWVFGEDEGPEDLEGWLDIEGEHGTFTSPRGRQEEFTVIAGSRPDLFRLQAVGDDEAVTLLRVGDGDALAFEPGGSRLGRVIQVEPVAAELLGTWELSEPGRSRAIQLEVWADRFVRTRRGETEAGSLYGLPKQGDTYRLALFPPRGDGEVIGLHPMADGTYLAFRPGDDDFAIAHRPGAAPSWLAAAMEFESVCMRAAEHFTRCLEAICADDPEMALCPGLEEPMNEAVDCEGDVAASAEALLQQSCEELFQGLQ